MWRFDGVTANAAKVVGFWVFAGFMPVLICRFDPHLAAHTAMRCVQEALWSGGAA
jgi:hypothetical protein